MQASINSANRHAELQSHSRPKFRLFSLSPLQAHHKRPRPPMSLRSPFPPFRYSPPLQ
jgi:hypothetical protein